jgi:hypothetical protein
MSWLKFNLFVLAVICCSCNQQKSEKPASSDNNLRIDPEKISAFAKQYGAIENWRTEIPRRGFTGAPFSYDLQKVLIQTNETPVLMLAELTDVVKQNGSFQAKFTRSYFTNANFEISITLDCSSQIAEKLLTAQTNLLPSQYALIVKAKSVSRIKLSIAGQGTEGSAEENVEVNTDQDIFCLKGECLDLMQIGNDLVFQSDNE